MGVSKTELAVLALAIVALVTAAIFGDFAALTVIVGSILAFFLAVETGTDLIIFD